MSFPFSVSDAVNTLRSGAHAVGSAASAVKDEAQELITGVDSDARQAQEDGNADREAIYDENGHIMNAAGTGVEMLPPVVVPEAFAAMSHEEMLMHVGEFKPGDVLKNAQMWTGAHAALEPLVSALWGQIDPILEHEWTGAASSAAKAAVRQYSDQSHSMLTLFDLVANKLMESHSGLEQTALMMPPLTSGVSVSTIMHGAMGAASGMPGALFSGMSQIPGKMVGLMVPGMTSQMQAEAEAARQEAVAVMTTVYTPVVMQSDLGVPALPPPFDPTAFGGSPTTDGGGGPVGFPGGIPGGGAPMYAPTAFPGQFPSADGTNPGDAAPGGPADTSPAGVQPTQNGAPGGGQPSAPAASSGPGSGSGSGSPTSSFGNGSSPSDTHAAGVGSGGYGSGGTAGGSGSAGGGMSGAGGLSGAGGSGSGAARGAFGSAGAQSALGGSGILGGAAERGGAAGRGGAMAGGGMMGGGGGKSGGGQDTEHKTAGYLITVDNGDELVGDLPMVAPPVIG